MCAPHWYKSATYIYVCPTLILLAATYIIICVPHICRQLLIYKCAPHKSATYVLLCVPHISTSQPLCKINALVTEYYMKRSGLIMTRRGGTTGAAGAAQAIIISH